MKYVLFVCTHNAGRSPDLRAESAGQTPRREVDIPDPAGLSVEETRPIRDAVEMPSRICSSIGST